MSCICGQTDPLPFTHNDGCPVWENKSWEWDPNYEEWRAEAIMGGY
jgi:hypothetical protein